MFNQSEDKAGSICDTLLYLFRNYPDESLPFLREIWPKLLEVENQFLQNLLAIRSYWVETDAIESVINQILSAAEATGEVSQNHVDLSTRILRTLIYGNPFEQDGRAKKPKDLRPPNPEVIQVLAYKLWQATKLEEFKHYWLWSIEDCFKKNPDFIPYLGEQNSRLLRSASNKAEQFGILMRLMADKKSLIDALNQLLETYNIALLIEFLCSSPNSSQPVKSADSLALVDVIVNFFYGFIVSADLQDDIRNIRKLRKHYRRELVKRLALEIEKHFFKVGKRQINDLQSETIKRLGFLALLLNYLDFDPNEPYMSLPFNEKSIRQAILENLPSICEENGIKDSPQFQELFDLFMLSNLSYYDFFEVYRQLPDEAKLTITKWVLNNIVENTPEIVKHLEKIFAIPPNYDLTPFAQDLIRHAQDLVEKIKERFSRLVELGAG